MFSWSTIFNLQCMLLIWRTVLKSGDCSSVGGGGRRWRRGVVLLETVKGSEAFNLSEILFDLDQNSFL